MKELATLPSNTYIGTQNSEADISILYVQYSRLEKLEANFMLQKFCLSVLSLAV